MKNKILPNVKRIKFFFPVNSLKMMWKVLIRTLDIRHGRRPGLRAKVRCCTDAFQNAARLPGECCTATNLFLHNHVANKTAKFALDQNT